VEINIQQGAKLFPLGSILSAGTYTIPEFHRGYAWKNDNLNKQLEEFWRDLELIRSDGLHYGGSLMLQIEKDGAFVVIDGQQRLTTVIILLAVLRDQMKKLSSVEESEKIEALLSTDQNRFRLKYAENVASENYMKGFIYKDKSYLANAAITPTLYSKNIEHAHSYFSRKIDVLQKGELLPLFHKLTTQFVLNVLVIDPPLDIHIAFETINNRGKKLSELELLKNRLLYLTTLIPKAASRDGDASSSDQNALLRENINRTWQNIYEWLGKDKEGRTESADEFLRTHGLTYFRFQKEANALHKTLFEDTFSVAAMQANPSSMSDLIEDYLASLQINATANRFC